LNKDTVGAQPPHFNVLLLTLDTTRADFLGCYGKDGAGTPNLDRLAREGTLFERAYTSNPVTQAAHSTILTGVYPMAHGVRDNTFFHLADEQVSIAEILKSHGYATAAAVGGFPLTREFGTAQGFDFYDDELTAHRFDHRGRRTPLGARSWFDERPAGHVNDAILPWLREPRDRPFFAWLHYWDPHEPHIAPSPYDQLFAHDPYQGEIAYADASLGRILKELEQAGQADRTIIVVTSDHGEGRAEHNESTHAFLAYDTTIHVPLIVHVPGRGTKRVAAPVGTVDIVPTLLELLGLELPSHLQGHSLVPLMNGEQSERGSPTYSESLSPRLSHGKGELRVAFVGDWKLIYGPRTELYNIKNDPRELHNVLAQNPARHKAMESTLRDFIAQHARDTASNAPHELEEQTLEQLEALGYLVTSDDTKPLVQEVLRDDGAAPQDSVGVINLTNELRRLQSSGQFHLAKRAALKLLKRDAQNPFYRASLVSAHLGVRQLDEAVKVIKQSTVLSSATDGPYVRTAQMLAADGQRPRALALIRNIVKKRPSANALVFFASVLRETGGKEGELAEVIEQALELEPDHRGALLERARHLAQNGKQQVAQEQLQSLMAADPMDPSARLELARLVRDRQGPEVALAGVERLLRLTPLHCEGMLEQVSLLVDLERSENASDALASMRQKCPDEALVRRANTVITGNKK